MSLSLGRRQLLAPLLATVGLLGALGTGTLPVSAAAVVGGPPVAQHQQSIGPEQHKHGHHKHHHHHGKTPKTPKAPGTGS